MYESDTWYILEAKKENIEREITLGPTRAVVSEAKAGMRHPSSGNDCLGRPEWSSSRYRSQKA